MRPTTDTEVAEAIRDASGPLELIGTGTKRALGHPVHGEVLDLSGIAGVVDYQPRELLLTARPGTPLVEVEALLAEHAQMLAFEPMHWEMFGGPGTLGGAIAVNSSGPRRFRAGAARDHVLGVEAVNGRGERFKSGGRVVKNVTGYDLSKLLTGSYGTLAAITLLHLKVLPWPETSRTLVVEGGDALQIMRSAASTPHDPTGLAHVGGRTLIRVEGPEPSVTWRIGALRDALGGEVMEAADSVALWESVAEVRHLPDGELWRVSVPPSSAAALVRAAAPDGWSFDHGGGLVWLSFRQAGNPRVGLRDGTATVVRRTQATTAPAFQPLAPALAALTARVKAAFDPRGILNPGRLG